MNAKILYEDAGHRHRYGMQNNVNYADIVIAAGRVTKNRFGTTGKQAVHYVRETAIVPGVGSSAYIVPLDHPDTRRVPRRWSVTTSRPGCSKL